MRHFDQPDSSLDAVMDKFYFAHTFQGSFGLSIEVPIVVEKSQIGLFEAPIERKVTERIVRGLSFAERAVKEDNIDIIVNNYETGFNSRMCEALVGLGEESNSSIEIGINWALSFSPSEDVASAKKYIINDRFTEAFREAAVKLREVEPVDSVILGTIINLHCTDLSNDTRHRTIIIKHIHEEYGRIEVRVNLNTSMYLQALEAHKVNKKVEVKGKLERSGSVWSVPSVSEFNVL